MNGYTDQLELENLDQSETLTPCIVTEKTKYATIAKKYKMHCEVTRGTQKEAANIVTVRRMETGEREENQDVVQK